MKLPKKKNNHPSKLKPDRADPRKKNIKLPNALVQELDKISRQRGWTTTRLVTRILEEFVGWANRE